jgi:tetratricopeptide (TPR) repeat protein
MKEPPKKKKTHHSPRQHITTSPIRPVKKNRYSDVEGLAIIVLLGIIIYSNSFDCSFHFDDLRQAFLTALLFVSHPLATQSVTYIVQRMASMVAMFYLLSIALYMKARLLNKGNTSKILLFTGSFISAVAAMFTKENAFTLPFAIVLFEFFFLRTKKFSINFKDYRTILLLIAFLAVVLILPLKFSFSIFKPLPPSPGTACTLTPFNYLFTQFSVIIKYIQLLLLPINQKLDYNFPIADSFFEIRTLLSFLVLLTLIILAIFSFKRYRIISFGIFWFFLTLSIESSFIPIYDVIYEHRTYLPSFGFFLILTSGIYLLLWNRYKYLAISIFVILIGSDSVLTYARNTIWKDDLALWNDNVLKTPDKARPFSNRGFAYEKLGQLDQAVADFSRAIGIDPNNAKAYSYREMAIRKLQEMKK